MSVPFSACPSSVSESASASPDAPPASRPTEGSDGDPGSQLDLSVYGDSLDRLKDLAEVSRAVGKMVGIVRLIPRLATGDGNRRLAMSKKFLRFLREDLGPSQAELMGQVFLGDPEWRSYADSPEEFESLVDQRFGDHAPADGDLLQKKLMEMLVWGDAIRFAAGAIRLAVDSVAAIESQDRRIVMHEAMEVVEETCDENGEPDQAPLIAIAVLAEAVFQLQLRFAEAFQRSFAGIDQPADISPGLVDECQRQLEQVRRDRSHLLSVWVSALENVDLYDDPAGGDDPA